MTDKLTKKITEGKMYPLAIHIHTLSVTFIKFNRDGTLFFTCANDGKVNIHNAQDGSLLNIFSTTTGDAIKCLDVSKDSKLLFVPTFIGGIFVYDIELAQTLSHHSTDMKIKLCELSYGDQDFLMGGDLMTSRHNVLCIFDVDKLKEFNFTHKGTDLNLESAKYKRQYPATYTITGLRIGLLNSAVFVGTDKGDVEVYDYKLQSLLKTVKVFDKEINSLTFSPRYEFLILTCDSGVKLVEPNTFDLVTELRSEYPTNCAQLSPLMYRKENPRFHVIMGGGAKARDQAFLKEGGLEVNIVNAIHGHRVAQLSGHYGPINWIECCPDGSGFVSAGEEAIVRYFKFDKSYHDQPEFD